MSPTFSELSTLVLVDVVAALPMEHVVRMARLGHERLRQACSLKWVTDRMTDVTFGAVVRAHQVGGDEAETFCAHSITKRLKGKMRITDNEIGSSSYMEACVEVSKQLQGRLHICLEGFKLKHREGTQFLWALNPPTFTSQRIKKGYLGVFLMHNFPEMVFDYRSYDDHHYVLYRPALLNGRHIVDVLRAVCGPADVSEAELDRVRREATEKAFSVEFRGKWWKGVWQTQWLGVAVVVHA